MLNIVLLLLTGCLLLLAPVSRVEAAIYVSVDEAGTVRFTDAPAEPRHQAIADAPASDGTLATGVYAGLISRVAAEERVNPRLVQAIIKAESNFDPLAVSPKGARGLMQLMPATADRYAVADVFDIEANIRGGARYLQELQGMFPGRPSLALAAYNAGENAVLRYGGIPPYPETHRYVKRVLDLYERGEAAADPAEAVPATSRPSPPVAGGDAPTPGILRMSHADGTFLYTNLTPLPPQYPTR